MTVSWEITPKKVKAAISRIIEASKPCKIILFGSYVSGKIHLNSDLDMLVVIKNAVENPRKESVRLRRALKGILMPIDIIVVQESALEKMANTPGLIYREAIKNGRIVYESAA